MIRKLLSLQKPAGALGLLLALVLIFGFTGSALAVPQPPHQFYGQVTVGGAPAPESIEVVAKISGVEYAATVTDAQGRYGYDPLFKVPADDPDTSTKEGGRNGETVEFYVAGVRAGSYVFESGISTQLNLAIDALPDTTAPVLTRTKPATLQELPCVAAQYTGDTVFEWTADEDLDTAAQPAATFAATGTANVSGTVVFPDVRTVQVVPAADLQPGTTYTLTVTGVKDKAGNAAEAVQVQFTTTPRATLPEGQLTQPEPIAFSGGNVEVTLPAGTVVASGASLEANPVPELPAVPESLRVAGQVVDIKAQGITLPPGEKWRIKLKANDDAQNPAIYYYNESSQVWEAVPGSTYDPTSGFVTAEVDHLSIYGVLESVVTLEQLMVEPSELKLKVGESGPVTVKAVYSDGTEADVTGEATYTSDNESVATVSGTGLVTAVGVGSTVIGATYDGKTATITVTVAAATQPPQDTTPPEVKSTDPASGAANVPVDKTLTVTFSEDVEAGDAYAGIAVKNAAGVAVDVNRSISGNVLNLDPKANLAYSTVYTVTIPASAVKDKAGNALAKEFVFSFTTRASSSGGGGGGGGGGSSGGSGSSAADRVEKTVSTSSKTVAEIAGRVRVEIPAGAVTGTNPSLVAELLSDSKAQDSGMSLISRVVDISLKNGTLDGQITIVLYYDKGKLGSNEEPVAFYYDEDKAQWVRLDGTVDSTKGTVTVTVDHLTMFAVFAVAKQEKQEEQPQPPQPTPVVTFKDMAGHWAEATVVKLAGMGVINGYEDGTFRPNSKITRAEIASILVRALNLQAADESALAFADGGAIPEWARGAVAAAVENGLVKGYPVPGGVEFRANNPITRAELAAILSRVLEDRLGKITGQPVQFADAAKIPAWAKDAVNTAAAAGVVGGYQDGTFRAQNNVTRAEAASMILRLLEKIE